MWSWGLGERVERKGSIAESHLGRRAAETRNYSPVGDREDG